MKRATLWIGLAALALSNCVPAPAEKEGIEEPENLDVVRLEVGVSSVSQPDKREQPIPQVPIGKFFWLEIGWVDPVPELAIELSNFKTVSFHHPGAGKRGEAAGAYWRWNDDDALLVGVDDEGKPTDRVVIEAPREGLDQQETITTRTKIRLIRSLDAPPHPDKPSLILFQTTVTVAGERTISFDPPWVEKPPTG